MGFSLYVVVVILALLATLSNGGLITSESEAQTWLESYNIQLMELMYKASEASWGYYTNLTDYNQQISVRIFF